MKPRHPQSVSRGLFAERQHEPEPELKGRLKGPEKPLDLGPEILTGGDGRRWLRMGGSGRVTELTPGKPPKKPKGAKR